MKFLSRLLLVFGVVAGLGYGSYAFGKYVLSAHLFGPQGANLKAKAGTPAVDVEVLPSTNAPKPKPAVDEAPDPIITPRRDSASTNTPVASISPDESDSDVDESDSNRSASSDSNEGISDTNDDSETSSPSTTRRSRVEASEREERPRVRRRRVRRAETQPTPRPSRRRVTRVESRVDETPARRTNRDEDDSPRVERDVPAPQIEASRVEPDAEVEPRRVRRRVEPREEAVETPRRIRRRVEPREETNDAPRPTRRRVEPREESPVPVPEGGDSPVPVAG